MESLLPYSKGIKFKKEDGTAYLFCTVRKTWIVVTPEEVVRQSAINYLSFIGYSRSLISVERTITFNKMSKRYDIAVFDKNVNPLLLVECKKPDFKLNQASIDQASLYNQVLRCKCIWITNGHQHLIYQLDLDRQTIQNVNSLPLPENKT